MSGTGGVWTWAGGTLLLPDGPREAGLVISGGRIQQLVAPGTAQGSGTDLDISGQLVIPGMVNAHDHLHFNCFPPYAPGRPFANATNWYAEVRSGGFDPVTYMVMEIPRKQRLLAGAFKNLLSGATTVVHHDSPLRILFNRDFPVTVPRIGQCHSLATEPRPERTMPRDRTRPWVIHAAEGTDRSAQDEIEQLAGRGCLGPRTVLVHCLGIDPDHHPEMLAQAGAAVVWCPVSNRFLYDAVAPVQQLLERVPVALGTDAIISSGGTMLDQLRAAREAQPDLGQARLLQLATADGAAIFGLSPAKGVIAEGADADLSLFPIPGNDDPLSAPFTARRPSLVVRGGLPLAGEPAFRPLMEQMGLEPRGFSLGNQQWVIAGRLFRLFSRTVAATRCWPPFGDSVQFH